MALPIGNEGAFVSEFPQEVLEFVKTNKKELISFIREQERLILSNPSEARNFEDFHNTMRAKFHAKFPETEDHRFDDFIRNKTRWTHRLVSS